MLTIIKSSFIEYKLTILRNKKTTNSLFRQTMNEISYLIASEVLKFCKYNKIVVETPIAKTKGVNISEKIITTGYIKCRIICFIGKLIFFKEIHLKVDSIEI